MASALTAEPNPAPSTGHAALGTGLQGEGDALGDALLVGHHSNPGGNADAQIDETVGRSSRAPRRAMSLRLSRGMGGMESVGRRSCPLSSGRSWAA